MNYRDRSPLDAGHWPFCGIRVPRLPSASVARHRLLAITRSDRAACNDGRWVKVRDSFCFETEGRWGRLIFTGCKPHYRWERRR